MGRVGSCYDNAVAESFFASLKAEIGTRVWATRAEARRAVFAYLTYYNRHRLHSTLNRAPRTKPVSATVDPSPSRHETGGPGVEPHSSERGDLNLRQLLVEPHASRLVICCQNPLLPTATVSGLSLVVGTWH